jgi:hypothetical protein
MYVDYLVEAYDASTPLAKRALTINCNDLFGSLAVEYPVNKSELTMEAAVTFEWNFIENLLKKVLASSGNNDSDDVFGNDLTLACNSTNT